MEEILKETARQVPAMVILLILCIAFARSGAAVVRSFLSQISEMRQEFLTRSGESRNEFLKTIERFNTENIEARTLTRATIHEANIGSDQQSKAIHELTLEVRQLRTALGPMLRKFAAEP